MANKMNEMMGEITVNVGRLPLTAAGTNDELFWRVPVEYDYDIDIVRVQVIPLTGHTGQATNYMSIAVQDGGALGTGTTAIVTQRDHVSGTDLTGGTAVTLTATGGYSIASGRIVRFRVIHTGTGNASPVLFFQVVYRTYQD